MSRKFNTLVLVFAIIVPSLRLAADQAAGTPAGAEAPQQPEDAVQGDTPSEPVFAEPELADQQHFDFRRSQFDRERLMPVGNLSLYSWSLLKPEPRGLRITIPWHQGKEKPTLGISPAFIIHGDFRITASYELVAADTPEAPAPVGGQIYIMAQETGNGASILRGVMPGGQQVYALFWAVRDETGRTPAFQTVAAEARRGRLRFARTGNMLHLLVAEEGSDEFRELAKVEFGSEPIGMFRAESITNGAPSGVETLWDQIEIDAEKLEPIEISLYSKSTQTP